MLILTEKPSVAKSFAEALGVPRKDNYYENSEYCIVNAVGHLLENYSPENYDPNLKKWSLEMLPIIPQTVKYKVIEKTKAQLIVIKNCFTKHKDVPFLLATDAEREGELIGAEILDYAGFKNYANAKRFWVSEALTKDVVLNGIKNAKPLSDYTSYKEQGFARQQADWLIGMNLTRLLTLKSGQLLHVGRVQTALLTAIYQRNKSIENFIPDYYTEVKAVLQGRNPFTVKLVNPDNEENPTRFTKNSTYVKELLAEKDKYKSGLITEIKKNKKTVNPPQLFNLTALQKEAHKRYGHSPEKTLALAQSLYEKHKCLSYPRTPSTVMGDENVNLVRGIYDKLTAKYNDSIWKDFLKDADPAQINPDNKRLFNSAELQDHHAIIPLTPPPGECTSEEDDIYSLVFERFFTTLKPPYIYNAIEIKAGIYKDGMSQINCFTGNGIEVIQSGWKSGKETGEDDNEPAQDLTGLEEGERYPVVSIQSEEKQTQPKKYYTFTTLLSLMENPRNEEGKRLTGLGTPATRGAILQKLVDRQYILLNKKNIIITEQGKFLVENILNNVQLAAFVSLPETTRWEERLHENTEAFLEGIKEFVKQAVQNTDTAVYQREKESLGRCPLCPGDVYEGKKNYYCGNYKAEKPCGFTIWKEICAANITPQDVQTMLAGRKTKMKKCISKNDKEFKAAFYLHNGKVLMQFENDRK